MHAYACLVILLKVQVFQHRGCIEHCKITISNFHHLKKLHRQPLPNSAVQNFHSPSRLRHSDAQRKDTKLNKMQALQIELDCREISSFILIDHVNSLLPTP